ncbi:MAG TPA: glutamate 5-kinase [Alphaproteobacteria bacterium]|nr:glutamate 5-kinase [Alphaproteobacteria bacterium]
MTTRNLNLVIKIGTAALGAADGMPDPKVLGNLVAELAALKKAGHQVILVSSGAVGTGRAMVKKNKPLHRVDPVAEKQILASLGQAKLMALYQELLSKHDLLGSQILLTKQDFRTRDHHKHIAHLLNALRQQPHILPIVNENDSVTNEEMIQVKNFSDNDELAGLLAQLVKANRLIVLSHIDGIYDKSPDQKGAKIISRIDGKTSIDTRGKSQSGRGGMASKLSVAKKMSVFGIQTHIASARAKNVLVRLLKNEKVGTTVVAAKRGKK